MSKRIKADQWCRVQSQSFVLAGIVLSLAVAGLIGLALLILVRHQGVAVIGGAGMFFASLHICFGGRHE